LATCSTFSGSIAIATGTSDTVNFPNTLAITGDLEINNVPNITTIGADSLQAIGGSFSVNNCQILSGLPFPKLTQAGNLSLQALPNLNLLGFTSIVNQTETLNIQNTFLSTLDGIDLHSVDSVYIANNRLLQDISFDVQSLWQALYLEANGDRLTASFPKLETALNLTFRDCPSISIPSLVNVTGSLGFYQNTFSSLSIPTLVLVGSTFAINTNYNLGNLSVPLLKTVGGDVQIQNNSKLLQISLPSLQLVGGATNMYGNFTR
jgi:hypothetical protein